MNDQTIPLDYANSLMYELEKAFWDERGKGARFRMMNVGQQYYQDNVKPRIQTDVVEDILEQVGCVLQEKGIVAELSYNREERLLKVGVAAVSTARWRKECLQKMSSPSPASLPTWSSWRSRKNWISRWSWPRSMWKRGPAS